MGQRLEGKVAIVTGGNSGIGAATARLFAAEGAKVVLMARREAEGHAVEASIREAGGEARFIRCDVTDRASIEAAVKETVDAYGAIHVLFNNAGGALPGEFPRESDDTFVAVLHLNLTSTYRMTRACWNHLLAAGGGTIVNMSSFAAVGGTSAEARGMLPFVPPSAYAAAKAGIEAFTRYTAGVGGAHGIRVNCVRPGQVLSPAANIDAEHHFAERYFAGIQLTPGAGTPEDTANAVLFLACDESRFINGQVLNIDGGAAGKV
ncbi:MAG: SDR family NAD(P)-dependent oxidoreductase [Dehalococcoidia bacterium]